MRVSKTGREFIKGFEGFENDAYKDGNVWSIGYGNTYYPDGSPVTQGDWIAQEYADEIFDIILDRFAVQVENLLMVNVSQNQFDALCSLAYNIGTGAFAKSTLLKKVNVNPNDAAIAAEFKKWVYSQNKILNGLVRRREAEAQVYFNGSFNKNSNNIFLYASVAALGLIILNKNTNE